MCYTVTSSHTYVMKIRSRVCPFRSNSKKVSVYMNTHYISYCDSPLGRLLLEADDIGLTGLWFDGHKQFLENDWIGCRENALPIFDKTVRWLEIYFTGCEPDFTVPIHMTGTDFQMDVWRILLSIPYGKTVTYGNIARQIAEKRGMRRMSARAVGQAVGRNPISIIVPCHRVVGANGSLTGYGGGLGNKIMLLKLEEGSVIHYEILEDERGRQ